MIGEDTVRDLAEARFCHPWGESQNPGEDQEKTRQSNLRTLPKDFPLCTKPALYDIPTETTTTNTYMPGSRSYMSAIQCLALYVRRVIYSNEIFQLWQCSSLVS